jgi:hypothetical protein
MKPLNILGLTIFSIGILLLASFGLYKFLEIIFRDTNIHIVIKVGIAGLILGVVVILISLVIERIKENKNLE